jgi:hypothetical protein
MQDSTHKAFAIQSFRNLMHLFLLDIHVYGIKDKMANEKPFNFQNRRA